MPGHQDATRPHPDRLAGDCRACALTFADLDALLERAATREIEMAGTRREDARLHALAAFLSFWMDRTLRQFPSTDQGARASRIAIRNVFREQGLGLTTDVLVELAKQIEDTPREGAERDEPEGTRTIRMSDTIARALVQAIRRHLGAA